MLILRKPSSFLQHCVDRMVIDMVLVVLMILFYASADAAVYQCQGKNGVTVLTDRPEGLQGCTQVQTLTPSPPRPASPTPDIPSPSDMNQRPTVIFPDSIAPPLPPRETFKDPITPKPDVEKPIAPTASDTERCASRINPLNPLAGGNCPPAAVDTPAEPKKP